MRYKIVFMPNPDYASISIDKRLLERGFETWKDRSDAGLSGETQPIWVQDIFRIEGVVGVSWRPFEITVSKGSVFPWPEVMPLVLYAIQGAIDPTDPMVEVAPPEHVPPPSPSLFHEFEDL